MALGSAQSSTVGRASPGENAPHRQSGRTLCCISPYFKRLKGRMIIITITFFLLQHFLLIWKRAGHGEGPQNMHAWRGISSARIPLCQPGATFGGLCWKRNCSPPPCSPYCELVSRPQLVPVMMLLLLQRDERVSMSHESLPMAFSPLVFKPSLFCV